ncbi:MAG: hypothetical protein Q4G09_05160 [Clostridia bacterium]|nr:hypothetical protein [Clostridia bacterium]
MIEDKMEEDFVDILNKILYELDFYINYKIEYIKDKYNSLYVKKYLNDFIIYVDIEEVFNKDIDLEILLYHEIYHLKQFLNNFPMIVSIDKAFSIIQNIVTDLYVDIKLIEDDYYEKSEKLFLYRINNIKEVVKKSLDDDDLYRIAFVLFELNNIFIRQKIKLEQEINKISKIAQKEKIYIIYGIILKNYKDPTKLYYELINFKNPKKKIISFNEKIII